MKKIVFILLLMAALPAQAEAIHKIYIEETHGNCYSVRLAKNWFITSAHCLRGCSVSNCTVLLDLMREPLYIQAEIKNNFYIHPAYNELSPHNAAHDIALIQFNPETDTIHYFIAEGNKRTADLTEEELAELKKADKKLAKETDSAINFKAKPALIEAGKEALTINSFSPSVKYLPGQYFYTENYSERSFKGLSGSGLFMTDETLAGIISGAVFKDDGGPVYQTFTAFNPSNKAFVEKYVKGISWKPALNYAQKDPARNDTAYLSAAGAAGKKED